jgi:hypothetical protein
VRLLSRVSKHRQGLKTILAGEISLPFVTGLYEVGGDVEKAATLWRRGGVSQLHSGFLRGLASLTTITGDTGTDDIFPGMLTTPVAGDDMVNSKLSSLLATVLASVLVTVEDLRASQLSLSPKRTFYQIGQADYRRYLEVLAGRVNKADAIFQHLGLSLINQNHRSPDPADVERFIILI